LKFNELTHLPNKVVDDKTKSLFSATNAVYDVGFVGGSKSIRMESGGYVALTSSDNTASAGVSISAWINLDTLANTSQHILKKAGVIDFVINTNSLALTLGDTSMTFMDIIPSPPLLNDEKFHFSDPETTTFGGTRLEAFINPNFYSNKLTLSTWVKHDPVATAQHNIISIGDRLHVGLNADKSIVCQIDTIASTTSIVYNLSSFTIENANYSGDIFNGIAVSQNTLAFDVAAPNANTKFKLKRISFTSPFRNSTPKTLNIVGLNGAVETTLLTNYTISYKNQIFVYEIIIDDTSTIVVNEKIKITFAGSGVIKIKDVDIEGEVEESINVSITSDDAANVTISGVASRQGTINVYSDDVNRTSATLLGSGVVSAFMFSFTFSETRGEGVQSYFVSLVDTDGNNMDFVDIGLSANIIINQAPYVIKTIPDTTATANEIISTFESLVNYFGDVDGDVLTFSITNPNTSIAQAYITGDALTIDQKDKEDGTVTFTLTATDPRGETASFSFDWTRDATPLTTIVEFVSTQEYTVPDGVSTIEIHAWGGGGNNCSGGYTQGRINVSSGTKLFIIVGGWNGNKTYINGWSWYRGGGLSGVFNVTDASSDYSIANLSSDTRVVLIAGGGGGANGANNATGGFGGGLSGGNGNKVANYSIHAGTGGTQTGGGGGGNFYGPTDNQARTAPGGGRFECGRAHDGYYGLRGNGGAGWWAGGGSGALNFNRGSAGAGGGSGYINTDGSLPVYNGLTTSFTNNSYYKAGYATSLQPGFIVLVNNPSP
jgi:hypothetical protein